jgi:hypothetical protein
MRTTKSLLLGAAAGLVATAGAQAADLPTKAAAIEYVKICSAYGAGFYYIPGTDICLRVGGAVRADYYHNATGAFTDIGMGAGGSGSGTSLTALVNSQNTRSKETHAFRGRGYFILDARQNTAYGTLRAFANIYQSWTTSATGASEGTNADRAFIQFAGFTFGRAQSFYDFYGSTGPHANLVTWNGQTTGATGWNVLAYTAQLGNGLSATLSMEDSRRKRIAFSSTAGALSDLWTTSVRAGQNVPAFVANLRVDQAWGSAQIMGAVQELRTTETAFSHNTWGYAVGGGFTWNNPSAPGSQFGIQASYAKGALGYVTQSYIGHVVNSNSTTSVGMITDAIVFEDTGELHKTTGWGLNAGYQHRFNPNWAWTIHGGYTSISYDSAVSDEWGGNLDYSFWSLGSRLLWTPVRGLDMGLDVMYHNMGSQGSGTAGSGGTTKTIVSSNDVWSAMFRVQRNF